MEENTTFYVPENPFFSDALHFTDINKFSVVTSSILVVRFLKENGKKIPPLSDKISSEKKVKKIRVISFPLILPIVKGFDITKGEIEDEDFYDSSSNIHEIYANWIHLQSKKYVISAMF